MYNTASSRTRPKTNPVGCKMNDAAYPFRGEHKLENVINHGHSGIGRKTASSLGLRITGSNLVIEQVQVPKGIDLSCEIAIDGSAPRPVTFQGNNLALAVPGDGREYNLTALLKNENMKHYCRMSFNGSDGKSFIRLRAPDNVSPDQVYLIVDGKRVRPAGGWFNIPLQAKDCAIVATLPNGALDAGGNRDNSDGLLQRSSLPAAAPLGTPMRASVYGGGASEPAVLPSFVLETVRGSNPIASLQCSATGQMIPLNENQAVAVPSNAGPYRLVLPAPQQVPAPAAAPATSVPTATPTPVPTAAADATPSAAGAGDTAAVIPEIETRVNASTTGGLPSFVVTAKNLYVQLKAENNTTVSGYGTATLQLPNRYAQRVNITITDAASRVVMKQTTFIPATQSPPINLRLSEDANGMSITAGDRCTFTVGTTKTNGTTGARVNRTSMQRVTAEQSHMDGSASSVTLDIGARPSTYGTGANPSTSYSNMMSGSPGASTAAGAGAVRPEDQWLVHLANALNAPNMDEARRIMQQVRAPNTSASTVVTFVNDVLFKPPPIIVFTAHHDSLKAIQCYGYNVSATIGNQPPCLIPANSQVSVPANTSTTLTAVHTKNGRQVAACRVLLATANTGASTTSPGASMASPSDADSQLVARLLDSLQRGNMEPQRVADDLNGVNTTSYTPAGQRTVPLLVNTLRHAPSGDGAQEKFFFTCGNGFLSNVYTSQPQLQLYVGVDGQSPYSIHQRGRVPATGTLEGERPHFVQLTARDPVTNVVKGETVLTVMGTSAGAAPQPASQAPVFPGDNFMSSRPSMFPASPEPSTNATPEQGAPTLDVALQQMGADCTAYFTCPPHLRIVCNIDGTGGDTGRSEFATKMSGDRPHRVALSLVDTYGKVVFQQKFDLPSLCSASMWGLALGDNGLALDPDQGATTSFSLDRSVESAVQGNFITFDPSVPHFLLLKKYINGIRGACTGELGLRLPGLTGGAGNGFPRDLAELVRLYKLRGAGQLDDAGLKRELYGLYNRCTSPQVRDLIGLLLQAWPSGGAPSTSACTALVPVSAPAVSGDNSRVYFRLTGNC